MTKTLSNKIKLYESGQMTSREIVEFFGVLIWTGTISELKAGYRHYARDLIKKGWIGEDGSINYDLVDKELQDE